MKGYSIVFFILPNTLEFFTPSKKLTFNDDSCNLRGVGRGMIGSEDLALGKKSVLFITSGDLGSVGGSGAESANPGGLWVYDMRAKAASDPIKIELKYFPRNRRFQPHGLDVSNTTDRVYAVSHNGKESAIEIFKIKYHRKCLKALPWSCNPVSLTYINSISSDLFPYNGINDVIEADANHVYVTKWLPFPYPKRGAKNKSNFKEYLNVLFHYPVVMLRMKLTTVFSCSWAEGGSSICEEATDEKFVGANGITIDREGDTVFVSDWSEKKIIVMKRDKKTQKLTKISTINLDFGADNIEYDDEADEILIGTIPDLSAAIMEREVVPGGMAVASKDAGGWKVTNIINHDGNKLSQIAAGSRLGNKIVLGSPVSEGILVCQ